MGKQIMQPFKSGILMKSTGSKFGSVFSLTAPDELQARADHGDAESQYQFAKKLFDKPNATTQDKTTAARYFKMAADQGHSNGQNGYGACLEFGVGVEKDMSQAAKYYQLSAEQNNPIGLINYGICCRNGFGMPKYEPPKENKDKQSLSIEQLEAAEHEEEEEDKNELRYKAGQPPSYYFLISAKKGDVDGQSLYGRCLLRGENVDQDFEKAEDFLSQAAERKDSDARRCYQYYSCLSELKHLKKRSLPTRR